MCESLTLIIIPEGSNLEYIGDLCFYKNGFRIISIPSKCSYIGMFAFKESKNLNTVNFAENSQCKQINSGLFCKCENLRVVKLPGNLTLIDVLSFQYCSKLESINLEKRPLEKIGNFAFMFCTSLTEIIIPSACQIIGQQAFSSSGIKMIDFGDTSSLEIIESMAFSGCRNLVNVQIPAKCMFINDQAFAYSGLSNLNFENNSRLISIGANSFISTHIQSIIIPSSCKSINESAFKQTQLFTLEFEANSNLEIIDKYSFGMTNLQKIHIPANCKIINDYAFNSCMNLGEITFEKKSKITYISITSFNECDKLEIFMIPDSYQTLTDIVKCIPKSITKIVLPDTNINNIPEECFKDFEHLDEIVADENTYIEKTEQEIPIYRLTTLDLRKLRR